MADMRGDGTVYRQKGSRFWWISYWVTGADGQRRRKRESSGSEEFKVARELLNQRRAAISPLKASALRISTPETVTIAELIEDLLAWYLTENPRPTFHKDTQSRWDLHLKPFFADIKASELVTSHLRAYRVRRSQEKAAFATINRELQILRKAYKLAFESEPPRVARVPNFKGAIGKEKNARKVFIDPVIAQRLKDAAAKEGLWARLFLEMSFGLGWRPKELFSLRVANIHLSESTLRIEDSKNGEPREVPFTEAMFVLLQPLILGRNPQEPLWPVKSMRYAWKRICNAAGVPSGRKNGFILYDSRRTSARTKRSAGVSESVIMDIQGWKTSAMFRRYGIVNQSDRLQALLKEQEFLSTAQKRALSPEPEVTSGAMTDCVTGKTGNA